MPKQPLTPSRSDAPSLTWQREIYRRVRAHWFAKMAATTLGITAFFMAYFQVMHHPLFAVTIMPLTILDRWVVFQPASLPIYLSLWVYVSFGPALLNSVRELAYYGLGAFVMSIIGLGIFLLWPTSIPQFSIDWTQHPSITFLKDIDLVANACPSMHVAFAIFTAIWLEHLLRQMRAHGMVRAINWLWCVAISYSTLATLQHVVLDVVAGAVLGILVAAIQLKYLPSK